MSGGGGAAAADAAVTGQRAVEEGEVAMELTAEEQPAAWRHRITSERAVWAGALSDMYALAVLILVVLILGAGVGGSVAAGLSIRQTQLDSMRRTFGEDVDKASVSLQSRLDSYVGDALLLATLFEGAAFVGCVCVRARPVAAGSLPSNCAVVSVHVSCV